jgi:uncharacterized membrane protein YhaH (DUF805 family)
MAVTEMAHGGKMLVVVVTIFFVLATVFLVLRFIARRRANAVGKDDWMAVVAYIFLVGVATCHSMVAGPHGYVGAPMVDHSPEQITQFLVVGFRGLSGSKRQEGGNG